MQSQNSMVAETRQRQNSGILKLGPSARIRQRITAAFFVAQCDDEPTVRSVQAALKRNWGKGARHDWVLDIVRTLRGTNGEQTGNTPEPENARPVRVCAEPANPAGNTRARVHATKLRTSSSSPYPSSSSSLEAKTVQKHRDDGVGDDGVGDDEVADRARALCDGFLPVVRAQLTMSPARWRALNWNGAVECVVRGLGLPRILELREQHRVKSGDSAIFFMRLIWALDGERDIQRSRPKGYIQPTLAVNANVVAMPTQPVATESTERTENGLRSLETIRAQYGW